MMSTLQHHPHPTNRFSEVVCVRILVNENQSQYNGGKSSHASVIKDDFFIK